MRFTCREVTDLLLDFLDDALPEEQANLLKHHICSCPPCMVYMSTYKTTIHLMRKLPEEPLPFEFAARLRIVLASCQNETAEKASS